MRWLRLLNPFRHLRLEREVAAIPAPRRTHRSTELITVADDLRAVRRKMCRARDLLACGLAAEALDELQAVIGDAPGQREAS